jgi:hypothetical protein
VTRRYRAVSSAVSSATLALLLASCGADSNQPANRPLAAATTSTTTSTIAWPTLTPPSSLLDESVIDDLLQDPRLARDPISDDPLAEHWLEGDAYAEDPFGDADRQADDEAWEAEFNRSVREYEESFANNPNVEDLDCDDFIFRNLLITGSDPHHLDRDGDGMGCEAPAGTTRNGVDVSRRY